MLTGFLREDECKEMLSKAPKVVPLFMKSLRKSHLNVEHICWEGQVPYKASELYELVDSMMAASDSVSDGVVEEGLVDEMARSLAAEHNRFSTEVYYTISCLCRLLQLDEFRKETKFKELLLKEEAIMNGTHFQCERKFSDILQEISISLQ